MAKNFFSSFSFRDLTENIFLGHIFKYVGSAQ